MKITGMKIRQMNHNFNQWLIIFSLSLVAFSCNNKVVYEDYKVLKKSAWPQDSLLVFGLNIKDSTKIYNLSLNVRNEGTYPYSNLWLFISIRPPSGDELKDTVELTLATPEGRWLGSGLGYLYERKYPYKQNTFFPRKGEYLIKVRQGMRTDNAILQGIHDFGICLEKAW